MILTALLTIAANALPAEQLNDLHLVKRGNQNLPYFYPPSNVQTTQSVSIPSTSYAALTDDQIASLAIATLVKELGVSTAELKIASQFKDAYKVTHVYVDKLMGGVIVKNHNAAVHIKNGVVASFSSSFIKSQPKVTEGASSASSVTDSSPIVTAEIATPQIIVNLNEAVKTAETKLGVKKDSFEANLAYLEIPGGSVVYVHQFQLRDDKASKWYRVSVDSKNGQIVQIVDYYNRAAKYNAIKFPNVVPTDGFEFITGDEDKKASPNGWNSDGTTTYTTTQGNNVDVSIGSYRPDAGSSLKFDSKWDASEAPDSDANKKASATHLFYLINKMHDISYQYGFTEAAGNFQQSDYANGGVPGDRVIANDQSSDGTDNADFATPPDGQSGIMNMYLFDITDIHRDGSLDSIIPTHEFTHGISGRLTGGARNGECLQSTESGGMGEGWSDTTALFLGRKAGDTRATDVGMGWYVLGQDSNGVGIRRYKYSTSMKTNPLTYSSYALSDEVHDLGEIWASTLNEVYWNLVDNLGFTNNWMNAKSPKGNIVAMQIIIGGMMLQPCNPTMLQARDAIILANKNYYNGANECDIWKGFAKRGLGFDAVQKSHKDGFKLPKQCSGADNTVADEEVQQPTPPPAKKRSHKKKPKTSS